MKAFVTGGTGFIGRHLVQRLREREADVVCLVRNPESAGHLVDLGATLVQGDITQPESLDAARPAMSDADVLFHCAGWYEVGLPPEAERQMERVNVDGTQNVLGLAVELGVPRIVYTSTAAVLGDTQRIVVNETHQRDADSPFHSAYDRTKYEAHQIAERYILQGAPIIIVMPTQVYGPGDHSLVADIMRLLLRRMLPILPAADTGFSLVHVDDVAEGHVLAAEKGEVGESYILGGDIVTMGDALQVVARLAGVSEPLLFLDSALLQPFGPLVSRLEGIVPLPSLFRSDTLKSMGTTWWVSSAKAEQELGYTHRALEEGMAETVSWEAAQLRGQPIAPPLPVQLALAAAALLLGLLLLRRLGSDR